MLRRRLLFSGGKTVINSLAQTIAATHLTRILAVNAASVLPVGVNTLAANIQTAINAAAAHATTPTIITTTAEFNTFYPVYADHHYTGYLLGAGSGVTLGQAARWVYAINPSADFAQATAVNQPLLLSHNGASTDNYWFSSGVVGNFCSAPNISIPTNSGAEIDFNFSFTANSDSLNASTWWAAHDNGGTRPLFVGPNIDRTIRVFWNNFTYTATSTASFPAAYTGYIRVKLETVGSNMNVIFSTSSDGITYTQLGSTIIVAGAANTYLTNSITFSTNSNNGSNNSGGKFYRITYKDANGVVRADFNPSRFNASVSQTTFTAVTGEVYTINRSNGQTLQGMLVDRTYTQGNGSSYTMTNSIAGTQPYTEFVSAIRCGTGSFLSRATGNARGHDATNYTLSNGTTLNLANTTRTRNVLMYRNNGASSGISVNDGTETTGDAGTNNGTNITFGLGAHIYSTFIQVASNCDAAQRTAIYNMIRSMNNL